MRQAVGIGVPGRMKSAISGVARWGSSPPCRGGEGVDVPAAFGGGGDRAGSVQGLGEVLVHDQSDRKLDRAEVVVASRGFSREVVEPLDGERLLLEAGPGGHAVAAEAACVHALFEYRECGPQVRGEVFLLALGIALVAPAGVLASLAEVARHEDALHPLGQGPQLGLVLVALQQEDERGVPLLHGVRPGRGRPGARRSAGEGAELGREGDDGRLEVLDVLDDHGRVGRGVSHGRAAFHCSQAATARLVMAFSSASPEDDRHSLTNGGVTAMVGVAILGRPEGRPPRGPGPGARWRCR